MKYVHSFKTKRIKDGLGQKYKVAKNSKKEFLKSIKINSPIVIYGQVIQRFFLKIIYLRLKEVGKLIILRDLII